MLIGLAAKNAILIVEFAKDEFEKGKPLVDAALEGARLRLRPILMTSFASFLDACPLWTATGAGIGKRANHGHHGDRRMLAASIIGNLFHPRDFLHSRESLGRQSRMRRYAATESGAGTGDEICIDHSSQASISAGV